MSNQVETSWDGKPVTLQDLAILLLIFLVLCGGPLVCVWSMIIAGSSGVAGQVNQPAAKTVTAQTSGVSPAAQGEGQTLFEEKCTSCHTIGGGKLTGPDLQGVTNQRDSIWLTRWLSAPDAMLAEGDAVATQLLQEFNNIPMPNLDLTEGEVAALIAYLGAQSGGAPVAGQVPASAAQPLPAGDPATGRGLFMGTTRLTNGGPPCMACHSIASIGSLGGGQLGPDLTPAFNKYGGAKGLSAFVANPPLPVMSAVWGQQPLTPQELADTIAFMQEASVAGRPIEAAGQLAALASGGMMILLVLAQLFWRRRLAGVRRPMLRRRKQKLAA